MGVNVETATSRAPHVFSFLHTPRRRTVGDTRRVQVILGLRHANQLEPAVGGIYSAVMYPAAIDPLALNRRPLQPVERWLRVVYLVACLTALSIALYLTAMKLTGHITNLAGCGGVGGCASILGGRWANWLRIPISVWAIGIYLPLVVLGILGFATPAQRRLALIGTSILLAAAGWFLYIQAVVERQFCPYCLAMHVCGLAAFGCVFADAWRRDLSERAVSLLASGGVASLAMMALVTGQFFGPQPDTHEITIEDRLAEMAAQSIPRSERVDLDSQPAKEPRSSDEPAGGADAQVERGAEAPEITADRGTGAAWPGDPPPTVGTADNDEYELTTPAAQAAAPSRTVSYFDGAIELSLSDVPLIGRPDARHILLKYFDYTCSSCRRMHHDLAAAVAAYPDDLAVIVIPCPLNLDCNPHADKEASLARGPGSHEYACELARLALAMWRIAPEEFQRFHNELFEHQLRMTPQAAILVGNSILQQERLEQASHDPWIDSVLEHSTEIYGRMKRANPRMPKVLLGDRKVLHGVVVSPEALIELLRQQFQLGEPQAP
jgi:uncharacterized membrane protein